MHTEVNTNHGPLSPYYLDRINETIDRSLYEHPRTIAIRVDCRLPNQEDYPCLDMPTFFADTDPAVITRFFSSTNAKIKNALERKRKEGKRVHPCTVRYVWARELNQEHKNHYHVLLLLNNDAYNKLGNYNYSPGRRNLATLIKEAWCSALNVDPMDFWSLARFPENPIYYLDRNSYPEAFLQAKNALLYRASYLAKLATKQRSTSNRSFGCSYK